MTSVIRFFIRLVGYLTFLVVAGVVFALLFPVAFLVLAEDRGYKPESPAEKIGLVIFVFLSNAAWLIFLLDKFFHLIFNTGV